MKFIQQSVLAGAGKLQLCDGCINILELEFQLYRPYKKLPERTYE